MDEEIGVTSKDRLILGKMMLDKDFNSNRIGNGKGAVV